MANKFFKKSKGETKGQDSIENTQSDKEQKLLEKIMDRYRASYAHKESLGMNTMWSKFEDYWAGDVNPPEDEDDPASETNIIQPIIESQVADLVDGQMEILAKAVGPSDQPFVKDVSQVLKWVWRKNKMIPKLDEGERDRLNLGTAIWKVYYDPDALKGRGLPTMVPCSPDTIFPDPKITDPRRIQEGDFFIQVLPFNLNELVRRFGDRAKLVKPEGNFNSYDPRIFGEDKADGINSVINDKALLFEYWEKDEEGKLRRIYCTQSVILDDSDWTHVSEDEGRESFYEHGKYPFVIIPCYRKKGRLWGKGDTEQLIPIQDTINDLDDQIRMNARLMGNAQTVVGISAGINLKKWTNKPGLKIPAKDHTAWETVSPPTIPGYIPIRRERAFAESELVSGRSDVVEGRRAGSLRAAAAIMALQEAGSRRANHKKLMLQEGFVEIVELLLDYIKEFMTTEQAYDITENGKTDYLWFRGSDLKQIPWKTLNENYDPESDDVDTYGRYKDLLDEEGKVMTKDAEFDLEISLGAGMPNSKSFIYQASLELHRENVITQEEARETIKQVLNWPIIDPFNPVGTFAGRNNSAEQLAVANGVNPPSSGGAPVQEMIEQGTAGGNMDTEAAIDMFMTSMQMIPPEILQTLLAQLGGMQVPVGGDLL